MSAAIGFDTACLEVIPIKNNKAQHGEIKFGLDFSFAFATVTAPSIKIEILLHGTPTAFIRRQALSKAVLEAGVYEFGFELGYVQVGKMMGAWPSYLDFEKDSISYTISCILTRSTPVSATAICTSKISLLETIDIAYLPPPKLLVISFEPIMSDNFHPRDRWDKYHR
ncbi:ph-response sensor protein, partial [Rhizina undulata]